MNGCSNETDNEDEKNDEDSDMYVNQVELQNWVRQKKKHRYEEIDGDEPNLGKCLFSQWEIFKEAMQET